MKTWYLGVIGAVLVVVVAGAIYFSQSSGGVAATVNGVAIPQSEVDKQVDQIKQQQPKIFEGEAGKQQEEQVRKSTIDSLVTAELIRQEAEKQNITVSKADVDKRVADVKKVFKTDKQFQEALQQQGLTEGELDEKIREQAVAEKMLKKVTGTIKISNKELKKYYDENKAQMVEPERKQWRHILVKKKSKADKLRAELEGGADFAELAKENSVDEGTKEKGGDLGLRQDTDFPPEISAGLKDITVDSFSEPIKGPDGYHIFQLTEIRPEQEKSFKEVKGELKQGLEREEQRKKFAEWLEKAKKKADIEITK